MTPAYRLIRAVIQHYIPGRGQSGLRYLLRRQALTILTWEATRKTSYEDEHAQAVVAEMLRKISGVKDEATQYRLCVEVLRERVGQDAGSVMAALEVAEEDK